eukprot:COSAG04_NODE_1638_length_6094_cov_4.630525_4_plen_71_part_00
MATAKTVGEQSSEVKEEARIGAQIFLTVSLALGLLFALTKLRRATSSGRKEGIAPRPAVELWFNSTSSLR